MFGLGFWEVVVIAVLVLLFIGPDKLPNFFRALGRATREFQRASRELRENLSIDEPPPAPKPPIRWRPSDVLDTAGGRNRPVPWPTAEDTERLAGQMIEVGRTPPESVPAGAGAVPPASADAPRLAAGGGAPPGDRPARTSDGGPEGN